MIRLIIFSTLLSLPLWLAGTLYAQETDTCSISGVVKAQGKPLPYASVGIPDTRYGTITNEKGEFRLVRIPVGKYRLVVAFLGYNNFEQIVELTLTKPAVEINPVLTPAPMELKEMVVTGTRSEKRRLDSAVPVNVLDSRVIQSTQSLTLSEGLSFQPGIRVEKDCQTCNYTQVRMNGLAGSYSQILLNSKPLFSSLTGLYGLEQLPASMIDRVEIVRGGGSVLYGSNAIAGTINIITRNPVQNTVELNSTGALVNGEATDFQTDLFGSLVSKSKKAGAIIIVSHRDREAWDANDDGFSELPDISNLSVGLNTFLKTTPSSGLRISLNKINEIRNGGDQLNREPHMRTQSEFRDSRIFAGSADYTYDFYRLRSRLDAYVGMQQTSRDHYTGSYGADGYGDTDNTTYATGIQLNHKLLRFFSGPNLLTLGFDYQYDDVRDEIAAYNYFINQETFLFGGFFQSDWDINPKINFVSGLRISTHNNVDHAIISPRFNLLYKLTPLMQFRAAYAEGFRAPQAFDTDMHIAFSGGGVAITQIDPGLQPESSESYTASIDYNKPHTKYIYGYTVTGFYTHLKNTFILTELPDSGGNKHLLRTNGSDAIVQGITAEVRVNYNYKIEADLGYTFQNSRFLKANQWTSTTPPVKKFLRTPDHYGYFAVSVTPLKPLKVTLSGVYTGGMTILHLAGAPGVDHDVFNATETFLELNSKVEYRIKVERCINIYLSCGIQNITNSFQDDFDKGPNRDSNYVYGPGRPRTFFTGIRLEPLKN